MDPFIAILLSAIIWGAIMGSSFSIGGSHLAPLGGARAARFRFAVWGLATGYLLGADSIEAKNPLPWVIAALVLIASAKSPRPIVRLDGSGDTPERAT